MNQLPSLSEIRLTWKLARKDFARMLFCFFFLFIGFFRLKCRAFCKDDRLSIDVGVLRVAETRGRNKRELNDCRFLLERSREERNFVLEDGDSDRQIRHLSLFQITPKVAQKERLRWQNCWMKLRFRNVALFLCLCERRDCNDPFDSVLINSGKVTD